MRALNRLFIEKKKIEIVITWRFVFYIIYILATWLLISIAIYNHYEHRIIMFGIWFMFTLSYPISLFLIQWKEVM